MSVVDAVQRRTARAGIALVARQVVLSTEVATARSLEGIASDCREIAKLCGGRFQDCLRKHGIASRYVLVQGNVVEPRKRPDAQASVRQTHDLSKAIELSEIDHTLGLRDTEAKPVQKLRAAGEKNGVRAVSFRQRTSHAGVAAGCEQADHPSFPSI